ncbi:DMT family transporter [Thalassospira sp. MA62]|nr:DMT family transporter [Thalassospira sp. MA62]
MGMNSVVKGTALIVSAVFFLSFSDALVKYAHEQFGLAQLFFLRSAVASFSLLLVLAYRKQPMRHSIGFTRWTTVRSLLMCAMWVCYYIALPAMSFAMAAAAMYTAPLFMAIFSRMILKTPISLRDQIALAVGFCGVLLALRPQSGAISPVVILPLLAAACYGLAAVITRAKCRGETAINMALNLNICLAGVGAISIATLLVVPSLAGISLWGSTPSDVFLYTAWKPLDAGMIGTALMLGILMTYIAIAVAKAYKSLSPVTVGLFDNAYLGFALMWGFMLFGDLPDLIGSLGILLIVGAAITSTLPHRPTAPTLPQQA